ncbi:MAG: hypothetical protein AAGE89_06995 [Pseudomonadota bacterium]
MDDEKHTDIAVVDPKDPSIHTVCKIIESDHTSRTIFSDFALSGYDVAITDDVPPQEAANATLEAALLEEFDNPTDLITALNAAWSRTKSRLETCWKASAEKGLTADRLSIVHSSSRANTAIAERSTILGSDELFVMEREPSGKYKKRYNFESNSYLEIGPPTQDLLARITRFSGHQKLELLRGERTSEYKTARAAFDEFRKGKRRGHAGTVVLRSDEAIATYSGYQTEVNFANGDSGSVMLKPDTKFTCRLRVRLQLRQAKSDIEIAIDDDWLSIGRSRVHERRFKTPAKLNAAVLCVLETLLILDESFPASALPQDSDAFDPSHPLLDNLTVPPRHQPLIGAILGAPYQRALAASKKFAKQNEKKAAKEKEVADLATILADGALFGRVSRKCSHNQNNTKLALVATIGTTGKRRKRQLQPLRGFDNPRPFTPKQIARLPLLKTPDALRLTHDLHLRGLQRDVIEAAFRLSFILDPGATNPLLETAPKIDVKPTALDGFDLRVTRISDTPGIDLLAIALSQIGLGVAFPDALSTGVGFMALKIGDQKHYHVRPALTVDGVSLPEAHQSLIEARILNDLFLDPIETENLLKGFKEAKDALPKRYHKS